MVGQQESSMHTYAEEEKTAYVEFINQNLIGDPELANKLPINSEGNDIFEIMKDGLLIMKMVNFIKPGTIDDRLFNKNARNQFQTGENLTVVLDGARSIGCKLQGITSKNIQEDHPEIFRLVKENESLDAFKNLASEMRLLRWFNYHLEKAGHSRRVVNISEDLKDGENYTILLNQLNKKKCSTDPLQEKDLNKRAELVLENSEKLGCKRFIKASDITNGNKELNLAFIADLFNKCPGFDEFDEKELNDAQRRILEEARKQREEEDRMWRKERDDDLRKRHLSIKMLDQEEEQKRRAMEEAARKKAEIEQEAELASKKKKEMEQQTEEMGRQKRELEEQLRKMKEEAKEFELRKQREKEEEEERKKKEEEDRKKKEEEEKFTRVLEEIRQKKEEIERKRKEEEEKKRKELEEQERLEEERRKRKMQDLEELKRKQEEDERRREEDEKKRKESEEERRLIEEEKRKLEDEKRKLAEMKKKEEEERRRREEEEQKRREEEERKRREEEQQRLQEEQDRKTREIADRKRREYELELELQRRRDQENEEMEKRLKLAEEKLRKEDEEKKKRERELQREKEKEKRKKEEEEKRRKQKERELELKKLEEQEETEDQLKRRALEERNLLEQELYDYTHGTPQTFQPVITDTQLRGDGVIQSLLTGDQSKDDLIFELCDDEDNTDKKIMDDRKKQADVVDENIFWFGKQADSTRLLEMAEKEVRTLFEDADRFKRKYDDKKKKQDDESKKEKANTKDKDKEKEKDKQQMFVGRELEKFFETDLEEQRQKDKDKLRAKEAEKEKTKDKDKDKDKSGKRKRSPSPNNDLFGDDEDGWIYLSPFLLTDVLLIHEYERKRLQYSVLRQQSINEWLQKHKQKDNRPIDIWQAGLEQLLGEGFSGWTLDDRKWILSELEKEGGGKIGANKIIQRHVDRYKRALKVDISLWPYTQPDTKGKIQSPASKQSTLKESDQPSKEQYEAKKDLLEADADLTIILLSRTSVTHIPLLTDPEFIGLLTDCLARHKRDLSYYPLASMIALLCRREDNHKAIISTNAHKLIYDIVKDPTKAGAAPISFSEMCCFLATSERGKITLLESGDKDYAAKAKMILVMYGNLDEYATRYVTGFFYQITKSKQYVPILKDKGVDKEIIDLLNRQATAVERDVFDDEMEQNEKKGKDKKKIDEKEKETQKTPTTQKEMRIKYRNLEKEVMKDMRARAIHEDVTRLSLGSMYNSTSQKSICDNFISNGGAWICFRVAHGAMNGEPDTVRFALSCLSDISRNGREGHRAIALEALGPLGILGKMAGCSGIENDADRELGLGICGVDVLVETLEEYCGIDEYEIIIGYTVHLLNFLTTMNDIAVAEGQPTTSNTSSSQKQLKQVSTSNVIIKRQDVLRRIRSHSAKLIKQLVTILTLDRSKYKIETVTSTAGALAQLVLWDNNVTHDIINQQPQFVPNTYQVLSQYNESQPLLVKHLCIIYQIIGQSGVSARSMLNLAGLNAAKIISESIAKFYRSQPLLVKHCLSVLKVLSESGLSPTLAATFNQMSAATAGAALTYYTIFVSWKFGMYPGKDDDVDLADQGAQMDEASLQREYAGFADISNSSVSQRGSGSLPSASSGTQARDWFEDRTENTSVGLADIEEILEIGVDFLRKVAEMMTEAQKKEILSEQMKVTLMQLMSIYMQKNRTMVEKAAVALFRMQKKQGPRSRFTKLLKMARSQYPDSKSFNE